MDYLAIYNNIINRAKNRTLEGYTELHHIIPRCLNGDDMVENLVELTAREHLLCHLLLVKIHPTNKKLIFAASAMGRLRDKDRIGCREYSWVRKKRSEASKTGKIVICKCGNEVWKTPHKISEGKERGKYCSKECSYKFRSPSKPRRGEIKSCETCSKEFYCSPSIHQKFCSRECKGKGTKKRDQKILTTTCTECNKSFERPYCRLKNRTNNFCNNECRLKYKSQVQVSCLFCEKLFMRFKYEANRKYCSLQCNGQRRKTP
jgi:hypothetical protein